MNGNSSSTWNEKVFESIGNFEIEIKIYKADKYMGFSLPGHGA